MRNGNEHKYLRVETSPNITEVWRRIESITQLKLNFYRLDWRQTI